MKILQAVTNFVKIVWLSNSKNSNIENTMEIPILLN